MILIYATVDQAKLLIVDYIKQYTNTPLLVAETEAEAVSLCRRYRPKAVLLFLPGQAGTAVDIQSHIREINPHSRVRILPSVPGTENLLNVWEGVVANALKNVSRKGEKS